MSDDSHREGVPAFVSAYDAVRAHVTREGLGPGAVIPGEVALADRLGLDRVAVQEALLLLQEDGYLVRDRTRQWVVAAGRTERIGFADSFHRILGADATPVRRLHAAVESGSSWVRELLRTDEDCLVWETVFARDGVTLASTLEFLVVSAAPPELLDELDAGRHDVRARPTLLATLGDEQRAGLAPEVWRVVPVSRHSERLSWMELPLHGIPAALTVVLTDGGVPVYLAKNLFDLATFDLTVDLHPQQGAR